MNRWVAVDRHGHEVYLTHERWQHIAAGHPALRDHRTQVLEAIRLGRRRRVALQPEKYRYTLRCPALPRPFNAIVVVVLFRFRPDPDGKTAANNYVVTAWPAHQR